MAGPLAPAAPLLPAGLPGRLSAAFSTRRGGVSRGPWASLNLGGHVDDDPQAVRDNRLVLARAAGVAVEALVFAEQVHGAQVAVVDGPGGPHAGVDALVSRLPGVALVVLSADCVPVLLADPGAGVVGAAHAGRRGLVAGVLQATVAAMAGLGAVPARISAVLGPAVCGRCYEVPARLADHVADTVPGSRCTTRRGTPGLDLAHGAACLLAGAGVGAVAAVGGCTVERPADLFSYRRDGLTGRQAAVVHLW